MNTTKKVTILGIFADREEAEDAIEYLQEQGYRSEEISIIMKNQEEAETISSNTGVDVKQGAATGAATGALIGGITGLVTGIGAIGIPGLGAVLIGGPIAAALGLTGAAATTVAGAATGALAGGIIGALLELGLPREKAEVYERRIKEGAILLAVPAERKAKEEVISILEEKGATDVNTVYV